MKKEMYGLVVCGGQSTRMGSDKSLIDYHGKPQRYYVYEMLEWICDKVFISCNRHQAENVAKPYATITDLPVYEHIGPMAALLTAFATFPDCDFLVVGCDYPYVSNRDLKEFLKSLDSKRVASAFYQKENGIYEPLLAWYSHKSGTALERMFNNQQYSLQHFLRENNAEKYDPPRPKNIISVDTPEESQKAKYQIIRKSHL
jgi:molybdopterin-guanine dinucleotide biosynthesis protein A